MAITPHRGSGPSSSGRCRRSHHRCTKASRKALGQRKLAQLAVQPIQERERLLRLEEASDLGPLRARQLRQGQGDLLLRPRPIVQLTIGTKDDSGPARPASNPLPPPRTRWNAVDALFQAPRAAVVASPASRGPAVAPVRPLGWLPRPVPRAVPRGSTSFSTPAGLPAWCGRHPAPSPEELVRSRSPVLLHLGDSRLEPRARVADAHSRNEVQGCNSFKPGRTLAIVGLLPQKPHHACGLDPHQDRSAVEEDLIETADQHQRPGRSDPVA